MGMTIKIFFILITLMLVSCGRSPFEGELMDSRQLKIFGNEKQKSNYQIDGIYFSFLKNKDFVLYDENHLEILTKDLNGNLLDIRNDELEIYLWMPEHGHGSYPISISNASIGKLLLDEIYFTMPGFWQLVIKFKNKEIKWPIYL